MSVEQGSGKILIVEDEMIIAADLSMQLTKLGYEVVGTLRRAEDALISIENIAPDLVLMDIELAGKMDGIEAAKIIGESSQTPLIFLTSNTDDATFKRAIDTKPFAFIAKPFEIGQLQRSIEISLQHIRKSEEHSQEEVGLGSTLFDSLFVRQKNKMVKIRIGEILFLEADRSYCHIHTANEEYVISHPLNFMEEEITDSNFLRVHRSFIINLKGIEAIGENKESIFIKGKEIPVSRKHKADVLKHVKIL